MFRYLNAEDICKFFDKFEDEVIKKSGLSEDELEQLSKREMNELLNVIFDDVVITKDNLHLYYEFVSDEYLIQNRTLVNNILESRRDAIPSYFEDKTLTGKGSFFGVSGMCDADISKIKELNMVFGRYLLRQFVFRVMDTLKPIDEYIAEIKESADYKAYIAKLA